MTDTSELYQQVILEHNKKPRNFRKIDGASHWAEGYNPLCGDHLNIYLQVDSSATIQDIAFEGDGCAISKASASMMTMSLKGKTVAEAKELFEQFHSLLIRKLDPQKDKNILGRLTIFSNIWRYPARVKCASMCWHTMKGALDKEKAISTE
jgi:nitrogen fixation NifU-like protein